MHDLIQIFAQSLGLYSFCMSLACLVAVRLKFVSLVDAVWSAGIGMGALTIFFAHSTKTFDQIFLVFLACFWSFKLTSYLTKRLARHFPTEDGRYLFLQNYSKFKFLLVTFLLFQAQAILQSLFLLPFMVAFTSRTEANPITLISSFFLITVGLLGTWTSDRQLDEFKRNPSHARSVCRIGLWKYSRHPNYFFEWITWCGFAFSTASSSLTLVAWTAPIVLLILLIFFTGIPPAEAQAIRSKGLLYKEYQQTTSAFVPWFPRRQGGRDVD